MKYFKELVEENGHILRHYKEFVPEHHKTMYVFDYSVIYGEKHGGTYDSFKYYNNYYVDLGIDKHSLYDELCESLVNYENIRNPDYLYKILLKVKNNWNIITN